MSYLGSIGYIMGGSGIKEHTADHISSGRAYAREERGVSLL